MKTKRFMRFLAAATITLAILLGLSTPALAATLSLQTDAGWRGEYYANPDLVGEPALVRTDAAIDYDWRTGAPAPGLPADNFSVRWTRSLATEEANYRFRAVADDGMRLFVDGVLLIDEWRDGPQRERLADRRMTSGPHTLRVEYYERGGNAVAQVRWEKLSSPVTGDVRWRGEYWANRDLQGQPALVRADAAVDFDWGAGAPASGLPADHFSARWTRSLAFNEGTYRFHAVADDGVRLFVDGTLAIDEWRDGSQREVTADRKLAAGTHTLRVEYYEREGAAVAKVWWEKLSSAGPDDPNWKGEYWANLSLQGNPAFVRSDPALAFDWGQGSPGGTIPSDNFSARWTRRVNLDAGTYRFHVLVDDGMRLWLNGQLILDAWSDHDSNKLRADAVLAKASYTIQVEYYERIGNARIHVWWERVSEPAYADWKGEYWANRNLSGDPALVRNDKAIDFKWGSGAPAAGLPTDDFSARWTRRMYFDPGTYRFHAKVDDGVRLWVDGQPLIDKWRDQEDREYTADIALAGGTHRVRVEYYEHTGGARIHVWWEEVSSPSYPDWKGEYWANRDLSWDPVLVRNDKAIDFKWGSGAPAAGLPADDFSARWSRQVTFKSGTYRFHAKADDGIRVYVDGELVLNEWHGATGKEYTFDLSLDGTRRLVVEYYERTKDARVHFWWERRGS